MARPATVGEIATVFLASVLTDFPAYKEIPSPEEIGASVTEWLDTLPARTPEAVADHYLTDGSAFQKVAMLRLFLADPDPSRLRKAEEVLLSARPRAEAEDLIAEYLAMRGKAGTGFLDRYRVVLREEMKFAGVGYFEREWSIRADSERDGRRQVEGVLRTLDCIVNGIDIDALLREFATSEDKHDRQRILDLLDKELDKLKPGEAVARWLAAVVAVEVPSQRVRLLEQSWRLLRPSRMAESEKPAWKSLLEDERAASPESYDGNVSGGENTLTVAGMAAESWNKLNSPDMYSDGNRKAQFFRLLGGAVFEEVALARAKAAVAGELIPPWPDDQKLTEPELQSLLAKLNGLPGAEVATAIRALPPKEKFSLFASKEHGEFMDKGCWYVSEVMPVPNQMRDFAFAEKWNGQNLTANMVRQLIDAMKLRGENGLDWHLSSGFPIPGIVIKPRVARNGMLMDIELKKPAILVELNVSYHPGTDSGFVKTQAVFFDEQDLAALDEKQRKQAEAAVEYLTESLSRMLAPTPNRRLYLSLGLRWYGPGKQEEPEFEGLPSL
jgi:hypothetical protein